MAEFRGRYLLSSLMLHVQFRNHGFSSLSERRVLLMSTSWLIGRMTASWGSVYSPWRWCPLHSLKAVLSGFLVCHRTYRKIIIFICHTEVKKHGGSEWKGVNPASFREDRRCPCARQLFCFTNWEAAPEDVQSWTLKLEEAPHTTGSATLFHKWRPEEQRGQIMVKSRAILECKSSF